MKTMMHTSAAAAVLAIAVSASAFAQSTPNSVGNSQNNWAQTRAELNADIANIGGELSLTTAAIGNSLSAELTGGSAVNTKQVVYRSDVDATSWLDINNVSGNVSATTAAIGNTASIAIDAASDASQSSISNKQIMRGDVTAVMGVDVNNSSWGSDDATAVSATAAAIGNSLSANVGGGLGHASNDQTFNGNAVAKMYADVNNIGGDISLTTAAIGNTASFTLEDATSVNINNRQRTGIDPTAITSLGTSKISGNVSTTTAALANSFNVSTLPDVNQMAINSYQENRALTQAVSNVDASNIAGDVTITAAAIGNSVNISGLPN